MFFLILSWIFFSYLAKKIILIILFNFKKLICYSHFLNSNLNELFLKEKIQDEQLFLVDPQKPIYLTLNKFIELYNFIMNKISSILFSLFFTRILILLYSCNVKKNKVYFSLQLCLGNLLGELNCHLIQSQNSLSLENVL